MASDLIEKRKIAKEQRRSGYYSQAAELYEALWSEVSPTDKWDGWGLAYCLNKLKKYNQAYQICKEVYKLDQNFEMIISQCSLSAFMTNIKYFPDDGDATELAGYANEIIKTTRNKRDDLFRIQTVLKMMDYSSNKRYWEKVIEWSDNIDFKDLSKEDFKGKSGDGKDFRKPSDKETYYLKLSKALSKLNRNQECLDLCNEGLIDFPQNVFLERYKGVSLSKLKYNEDAIAILKSVVLKKQDWFILKDLSAAYYRKGDYSKALEAFLEGAINSSRIPNPENRWELYYLGAKIYDKLGDEEKANKHLAIVVKLREENDWKIPDYLEAEIQNRELDSVNNRLELFNELKTGWTAEKMKALPLKQGRVSNLIADGKAGFIKVDQEPDIFFNMRNKLNSHERISKGDKVNFRVRKSFDKSKNQESLEAVFITKETS